MQGTRHGSRLGRRERRNGSFPGRSQVSVTKTVRVPANASQDAARYRCPMPDAPAHRALHVADHQLGIPSCGSLNACRGELSLCTTP